MRVSTFPRCCMAVAGVVIIPGTFGNPTIFAMLMALCLPVCVFLAIRSVDRVRAWWR